MQPKCPHSNTEQRFGRTVCVACGAQLGRIPQQTFAADKPTDTTAPKSDNQRGQSAERESTS